MNSTLATIPRALNLISKSIVSRFYTARAKKHSIFIYLTPFVPLSFKGEGDI